MCFVADGVKQCRLFSVSQTLICSLIHYKFYKLVTLTSFDSWQLCRTKWHSMEYFKI